MTKAITDRDKLFALLQPFGQTHLLQFWEELEDSQKQHLASQISKIDLNELKTLRESRNVESNWTELAEKAEIPPAISLEGFRTSKDFDAAVATGRNAIASGKVAMILVAGGQGSRLGFEHPKGMYPIGPVSNRSLYQIIIEKALARARQFESTIPLYIMTSPPTHDESRDFLYQHDFFGYGENDLKLFCQGVMPAVDNDGKLLLADKHTVFVSPDGHGGTLAALDKDGCLDDMTSRGIEYVFYGQIDNPLMQVCEPALIGYHILKQSEMTSQIVRKNDPMQKVGNVVSIDGKVQIIEYSDLPEKHARQINEDGSLKLWAGSIAVHIFDLPFLLSAHADVQSLRFHHAKKKVPFVDTTGKLIEPDRPNATKFEKFIFDLLPSAKNAIVCEVDPAEGFCSVKNAPPATSETPDHVRAAISNLHSKWLKECGVRVASGIKIEINPLFAVDSDELAEKSANLKEVKLDKYFV